MKTCEKLSQKIHSRVKRKNEILENKKYPFS